MTFTEGKALATHFVSSATSTSVGAVMGALECPAVGSSVFSSPFVELITCRHVHIHIHIHGSSLRTAPSEQEDENIKGKKRQETERDQEWNRGEKEVDKCNKRQRLIKHPLKTNMTKAE